MISGMRISAMSKVHTGPANHETTTSRQSNCKPTYLLKTNLHLNMEKKRKKTIQPNEGKYLNSNFHGKLKINDLPAVDT